MAIIDLKYATLELVDAHDPPATLEIYIGEGNLEYTEKRAIDVVKRRGLIETAREGEEQEMEVGFQFVWEHISAHTADDPPTIEDALKRKGPAAGWLSTNADPDAPFCLDLRITYVPPCGLDQDEVLYLQRFHYEDLAHSLRDASVDCKGRCLATQAVDPLTYTGVVGSGTGPGGPGPAPAPTPTATPITPPTVTAPTGSPGESNAPLVPEQFTTYAATGTFSGGFFSRTEPPMPAAQSTDSGYSARHWVAPSVLQYDPFPANEVTACVYVNLGASAPLACVGIRLTTGTDPIYFFKGFGGKVGLAKFGYAATDPAVTVLSSVDMALDQALWMRIKGGLYQTSPDAATWTTVATQTTLGGVPSVFAYNPSGAPQNVAYTVTSFYATYVRADLGAPAFTTPVWSETNSPAVPVEYVAHDAASPTYSGSTTTFLADGSVRFVAPPQPVDQWVDPNGQHLWAWNPSLLYGRGADRVTACIHPAYDPGNLGCIGLHISAGGNAAGEVFFKGFGGKVGTLRFGSQPPPYGNEPKVLVFNSTPVSSADCLWMRIYGTLYQTSPDGVTWTTVATRTAAGLGSVNLVAYNPFGSAGALGFILTSLYATYPGQTSR